MSMHPTRRTLGLLTFGMLSGATAFAKQTAPRNVGANAKTADTELAALEARGGGRLGVFAVDTGTGATISHRADERFPMCSTHKVLVGGAILSLIEAGKLRLDQMIPYGSNDLLEYAPVTKKNLSAGAMSVQGLCEAAIRWSDNTADNLLLKLIDGPAGWTRYARSIGDTASRLDRFEPELNTSLAGDPRDTSTPAAMTRTLATLLFGTVLNDASRAHLKGWMLDSEITAKLLPAGVPSGWHVADKSGSGANGSRNDIGVLFPARGAPIVMSVFYTGSAAPQAERETIIARCATIAARTFR